MLSNENSFFVVVVSYQSIRQNFENVGRESQRRSHPLTESQRLFSFRLVTRKYSGLSTTDSLSMEPTSNISI